MGKVSIFVVIAALLPLIMAGEEVHPGTVEFNASETYLCRLGESVILELPGNEKYTLDAQGNDNWMVDGILNLVWVCPKVSNDLLNLVISDTRNRQVKVAIRSVSKGDSGVKKILIRELNPAAATVLQPATEPQVEAQKVAPKPEIEAKVAPEKPGPVKETDKDFDLETYFSLTGGIFSINKKGNFTMDGELVVAGKSRQGLFGQFSALFDINGFQKRYGQSIGAGYENDKLGFFLFADLLETKLDEYMTTIHYQVRPAVRFRSRRLAVHVYLALAISNDQYTGTDDADNPDLGVFNKAVTHFGFELDALVIDKLLLKAHGVIGNSSIYRLGLGVEFNLAKNIQMKANMHKSNYGDYPLLLDMGYGNSLEFSAGLSIGMGRALKFFDRRTRIIFPRDYPLVVNLKKEKDGGKSLKVSLSADPVSGYAPLDVSFSATVTGGESPYTLTWDYNFGNSSSSTSCQSSCSYPVAGVYYARVSVKDKNGGRADSNVVTIQVYEKSKEGKTYTITVTAGTGGTVTPGTTLVEDGRDSPNFIIQPNSGYEIDFVLVDSQNQGKISSYQFKAVYENHELAAFFRTASSGPSSKYTIDASAGTGLSISPSGSIQYNAGESTTYTVSVTDADFAINQVIVDGAVVVTSPAAPYTYQFNNIQANHTINVTSKRIRFTITATAGENGSINPSGSVKVNLGENQSFTATANSGYDIDQVLVDGAVVASGPMSPYNYTFTNVSADHTISVTFKVAALAVNVFVVAGSGTTNPLPGTYLFNPGNSFTIQNLPASGFIGDYIDLDGVQIPYQPSYTFNNITKSHWYGVAFVRVYRISGSFTYVSCEPGSVWTSTKLNSEREGSNYSDSWPLTVPGNGCTLIVDYVIVDGVNMGQITSVTFTNIHEDHSYSVYYKKQ